MNTEEFKNAKFSDIMLKKLTELKQKCENYYGCVTEVHYSGYFKVNYTMDIWRAKGSNMNDEDFRVYCSESHLMALTRTKIAKYDFTLREEKYTKLRRIEQ